ncbi:hypothetical protein RCL_jg3402.t4 [Rhizophagus clarus]|uniref:Uncharacterized protein n=1 Tax=Rhizophagus clarus TaxID=94130 RepID=A0A8H3R593_9GLOM|nr:hypothetical protein RCL_jg3402.t4 [Rhizophagus clarus]
MPSIYIKLNITCITRRVSVAYSSDLDALNLDDFGYSNIYGRGFQQLQILSGSFRIFGLMKNTRVTESLNVLTARFLNMNMNVWLLISCGKFDSWQDEYIYDLLTLCRKFDDRTSKRSVYWISGGGFSKGLKVSDFWVNGKADLTLNLTFDLCNSGFD